MTFDRWRPTAAYFRAASLAVGLTAIALLFERADMLVLATPMAVVTAWSVLARPMAQPFVEDRLGNTTVREGDGVSWLTEISGGDAIDVASVAVADMEWFERKPARGAVTAAVVGGQTVLRMDVRSIRWGRRELESPTVTVASPWGAFAAVTTLEPRTMVTLPLPSRFESTTNVRPADGLVGSFRSVRPGEGSEFASVRSFQVGDRMRRINWTRSSRTEELQVNATWADQDSHVALVVDVAEDLGTSGGIDNHASSLDTTVRAAGAIAEFYVSLGNRVSLRSFDPTVRLAIAPSGGQAHLRRVLDTLARLNGPVGRLAHGGTVSGPIAELTVILTPLASADALDRAVSLARRGGAVVVVDTLPDHVVDDDDPYLALAWRLRLLQRRREVRRAEALGVAVLQWRGSGSLDVFLRGVARSSVAPKVRS